MNHTVPAVGLLGLIALLSIAVFAVAAPLWVYSDARRNSPQSPALWALVAFFGGPVGLLAYGLLGRDAR